MQVLPMRAARRAIAVAACVLAAVLVPEAAFAATVPTVGGDVSRYQCTGLPALGDFAVVAVNTGLPTETNPCLAAQLAWAAAAPGTGHSRVDVYVASANPSPATASWWPKGDRTRTGTKVRSPYGACTGTATRACSWVYGNSLARDDLDRGVTGAVGRWWIDVEQDNTWSGSTTRNRAVVEGMTSALHSGNKAVGVYALTAQLHDIVGTVPASSALAKLPTWVAGAKDEATALQRCSSVSPTAGRLTLVQWADATTHLDQDVACATFSASPKPTISGRYRSGATLTAKTGTWGPGAVQLTYRWTRDGHPIANATHPTYRLKHADRHHRVSVTVTATETGYSRGLEKSSAHRIHA
jgi:hypothetical protein